MRRGARGGPGGYGDLRAGVGAAAGDAAAPAAVVPAGLVLRVSVPRMTGRLVREVLRALAAAGFSPGPIDGVYAGQTAAAVRALQMRKGLAVDGEVGRLTAKALGFFGTSAAVRSLPHRIPRLRANRGLRPLRATTGLTAVNAGARHR